MKKLRNNRGETLVEVLASIVVAALSVTLLFGCIMAASAMDKDAQKRDEAHYNALSEADSQVTPTPEGGATPTSAPTPTPYVTIIGGSSEVTPPITIYGGEGMYSYKRAGS